MEKQTQLRSNYIALRNVSDECECPQSMKCTVDVNRISGVLDSYYVKFQNFSKEKNKNKTPDDNLSIAFLKEATANPQSHIRSVNGSLSTPNIEDVLQFGMQEVNANEIEMQQKLLNGIVDFVVSSRCKVQFNAKFFNFSCS